MSIKPRRNVLSYGNDRALIYALVFLICALMSALGAGGLAVLCFVSLVVVGEVLARWVDQHGCNGHPRS